MRRATFVVGLVFCGFFFLISTFVGVIGLSYDQDCHLEGSGAVGGSASSELFPPGTRCAFELPNGTTKVVFQPSAPALWLWTACCIAFGTVPASLLLRIKDAQDAKRGGPSF